VLPVAAPTIGNARLSYALPGAWPTFALAARYASRRAIDDYTPEVPIYVKPQVELRGAVSGALPVDGLSYRFTANYTTREVGPYGVGAWPADGSPRPVIPVDSFRIGIGLQYDLFP
jgi:hypothetical protein